MFGPDNDTFADNLQIPENIHLEKPMDLNLDHNHGIVASRPENTFVKRNKIDFQLYNSFQPGLYEYDILINSKENGVAYLKAFEISNEIQLSKESLLENSAIPIENTENSYKIFGTQKRLTIYEGDWDKPYAARFELWFKADNSKEEIKLLEKNYIIEGWQR